MTNEEAQFISFSMQCTKGAIAIDQVMSGKHDAVARVRLERSLSFLRFVDGGYSLLAGEVTVDRLRAGKVLKTCQGRLPQEDLRRAVRVSEALLSSTGRVGPGDVPHLYKVLDILAASLFQACRAGGCCF